MGQRAADRVWRVGLYIRLSKEDGRQESLSVANQRKILLDYLANDFPGRWELAGIFVDDGLTGTDDSRAGFQEMIAQVRAGEVDCVICKTLSRAFRNYADQGYFLEEFFPRYRTRFISLGSPRVDSFLDPEAVQMGLEIPINGLLNDRYAARTSADVRRTLDMKRRRVVSYKVHQTFSVPPEEWYVVADTHPAIVPPADLQRAAELAQCRTRRPPGGGEVHLFAGLLRCADCGRAMSRKTAKGIVYYTCSTYRRKSKTACTKHTIREDRLRRAAASWLGCGPQELTRALLFARIGQIKVQEGGEVEICPLREDSGAVIL